jgi:hypothetical protein
LTSANNADIIHRHCHSMESFMLNPPLETFRDFSGSAEDLARLATRICAGLGLGAATDTDELSSRLVRDYAQREILSRPERLGKEAIYTWRHLVELVAARALVADGWPLAKVTQHFALTPLEELLLLVPGQVRPNPALMAAKRIRESTLAGSEMRDPAASPPLQGLVSQRQRRADLMFSMKQLTGESTQPRATQMTRIALDEDIHLLIQTDRLRNLGLDGADAVGRAITASIIEWITAKGGKQP